ncbi:LacI family DNA-binding transcriptional regulator [Roseomonas sp. BN140053]|uniref:LacI family DNA-binding transcriptional regulator n=1 Tax=Roseomonas sp. BN140053 TaxID=3391898 RepID=UPI0039E986E5
MRITDVAAAAGVSAITVSRALNTPELLSKITLRRVRAAVERLGYVPNLTAGALSSRRSRLVVAIVPTIGSPMYAETLQAFTTALSQAGYHVLLGLGGFDARDEEQLITALLGRQPDGLLLVGAVHSPGARRRLSQAGIPILEIWGDVTAQAEMQVGFSHAGVGEAVANHLCDRGYRSFGVVSSDDLRALERFEGFRRTLDIRGCEFVAQCLVAPPSTILEGRRAFASIHGGLPTGAAVFCSSDLLAAGLLIEASLRGVRVPRDLAICGFGNLEIGRAMEPALTTVSVDGAEMGQLAARCMVDRLAGNKLPRRISVPVDIVQRGTT